MKTDVDVQERRCPRLGGNVTFGYCRSCGEGNSVCPGVIDCWWESFDVVEYFRARSGKEELSLLGSPKPPKNKVVSLLEMIRGARRRLEGASDM